MAVGTSQTLNNNWLNVIRGGGAGTTYTAPAGIYVQLHTGSPGSVGTALVSSTTTRGTATFGASTTGSISLSNTPSWASWAGTNGEVVSHVSFWDATSSGNFLWSASLSASKTVNTGDTLNLSSASLSITNAS